MDYNGSPYYYAANLQGDTVAILDGSGNPVVTYTYDAWGKLLSVGGSLADTLGAFNPLTYRGYVYDTETEFYYLQSRYYNPTASRFLNADAFASTGQGLLGNNMFAYCLNNPVAYADYCGSYSVLTAMPAVPFGVLPFIDGPIPVGDIVVVIIILFGITSSNDNSTPELKHGTSKKYLAHHLLTEITMMMTMMTMMNITAMIVISAAVKRSENPKEIHRVIIRHRTNNSKMR